MERLGFDYLAEFGQVILMNNSSVGPIYGLKMVFDRMRREQKDFWGITLYPYCADGSFINEPYIPEHIQSYFVVFNQNVVQSEVFRNFWKEYRPSDDFTETVARGETKLTPMLVQGGFTYGAYLPESRDLVQWFQTGQPQNELAYQYAVLGSPFLKKKAVYFLTIENRKKLLSYLEQLPVPECLCGIFQPDSGRSRRRLEYREKARPDASGCAAISAGRHPGRIPQIVSQNISKTTWPAATAGKE